MGSLTPGMKHLHRLRLIRISLILHKISRYHQFFKRGPARQQIRYWGWATDATYPDAPDQLDDCGGAGDV
jgi:hypothetical protein